MREVGNHPLRNRYEEIRDSLTAVTGTARSSSGRTLMMMSSGLTFLDFSQTEMKSSRLATAKQPIRSWSAIRHHKPPCCRDLSTPAQNMDIPAPTPPKSRSGAEIDRRLRDIPY